MSRVIRQNTINNGLNNLIQTQNPQHSGKSAATRTKKPQRHQIANHNLDFECVSSTSEVPVCTYM